MVYDITNQDSFHNLTKWLEDISEVGDMHYCCVVDHT